MEEDIKVLEKLIKFLNKNGDYIADENFKCEKQAIEHLIKSYKDLEENYMFEKTSKKAVEELLGDSIPKSLVIEKIKKMDKIIQRNQHSQHRHTWIEASIVKSELQKLLGDN